MALPRDLVPGQPVTWTGAPLDDRAGFAVAVGERGVFVDYDGEEDTYVVSFPGGRVFCCPAASVEPDLRLPPRVSRRHNGT